MSPRACNTPGASVKGSRCHWLNQQRIPPRRGDSPSIRPLGRTLWERVCCQRAPQDGSVSPPPSLSSPQSDGPYYVHRCPGPASPPGSVTGEPCGLGADACPPGLGLPVGEHRGAARPPQLPFPPRLGGDALGEAPGRVWGRFQAQAAEMWRPQGLSAKPIPAKPQMQFC